MDREVYGKNGDSVLVMDVRDVAHGDYSVEILVYGGYKSVYMSPNLEKCLSKAKRFSGMSEAELYRYADNF